MKYYKVISLICTGKGVRRFRCGNVVPESAFEAGTVKGMIKHGHLQECEKPSVDVKKMDSMQRAQHVSIMASIEEIDTFLKGERSKAVINAGKVRKEGLELEAKNAAEKAEKKAEKEAAEKKAAKEAEEAAKKGAKDSK